CRDRDRRRRVRHWRGSLGAWPGSAASSLRRADAWVISGNPGRGARLLSFGTPHRPRDPCCRALGGSGRDRRSRARAALSPRLRPLRHRGAADRRRARATWTLGDRAGDGRGAVTALAPWLAKSPLIAILRGVE